MSELTFEGTETPYLLGLPDTNDYKEKTNLRIWLSLFIIVPRWRTFAYGHAAPQLPGVVGKPERAAHSGGVNARTGEKNA